jgi:hypothetical protein
MRSTTRKPSVKLRAAVARVVDGIAEPEVKAWLEALLLHGKRATAGEHDQDAKVKRRTVKT